ncbi:17974_t:CDS:2, partial [Racocetra persica]
IFWARAKPVDLEEHLALDCPNQNKEVKDFYNQVIANRQGSNQAVFQNLVPGIELNPNRKSLWNFVIHTSSGREYLWKLVDLSNQSHSGEVLKDCIQQIFDELDIYQFLAIVTDGGSNCSVA